jgi:hypothetical protein
VTSWLSLAASAVLLLAAVAAGSGVLRALGAAPRPGERVLYALLLGLGVQGTLLLALSALGWMHPAALWAVVILPGLAGLGVLKDLRAFTDAAQRHLLALTSTERITLLVVLSFVSVILFVGALAPVTDWDSQMYHMRIPEQLLAAGRLYLPADGNHLAFLGLFQFLYLPLMAIGADAGPAILNAAMTLSLAATVAVAGTMFFSARSGVLVAIAVWGSSSLLLVGATPRVDIALTAALAITHLAVVRSFDEDGAWAVPVAALVAGVALTMKYHALPYVGALAPFALWATWRRYGTMRDVGRVAAVGAALVALAWTPWLIKNLVFFGAPLFPFLAEQRLSPFIAELTGSFSIPAEIPREALRAVGQAREPISLEALIFRPSSLTIEQEARAYTRNPLFALLPLALLYLRDMRLVALALPGAAYLAFTLGWFNHTNLRYIIPALPMLALLGVESLRRFSERFRNPTRVAQALALAATLAVVPALQISWDRNVSMPRAQVALGLWQRESLLMSEVPYAVSQFVDEYTPADARILMLFEARGLYFNREVLQDNLLTNLAILQGIGATDRCLAGSGITHVLVNELAPRYYAGRGASLSALGWERFPEFAARCLQPVGTVRSEVLYRVR